MGNQIKGPSLKKDQKILMEFNIPLQPEAKTLEIFYHAVKKEKNRDIQKLYYTILFQMIGKDKIEELLI